MSAIRHVVMYSGGVGSYVAARRVVDKRGADGVTLLFCDTKCEHPDTYRFLREGARALGVELVEIAEGRTIWELFRDERLLGTNRLAICSRVLKRELADRWLDQNRDPASTVIYVGIDWSEEHRFIRLRDLRLADGWQYEAPLCEAPYLTKEQMHEIAARDGLKKQALYDQGAAHANCGGGCVRMGQGGFVNLLRTDPERFAEWEQHEQELRAHIGKDVSILRDRRGGRTRTLTLRALRQRVEAGGQYDMAIGGCGCFSERDVA